MNILFLGADDLGREQVREYGYDAGNTYPTLPRLSALIQNGVRFTRAHSQPWCSPTRVKWHTGLQAYKSGVAQLTEQQQPLLEQFLCLPAALKIATGGAMRTACFGKYHMADWASKGGENTHPCRIGYDYYAGNLRNLLLGENFYSSKLNIAERTPLGIKTGYHLLDEFVLEWQVREALKWVNSSTEPFFLNFQSGVTHDPLCRPPDGWYDQARWGLTHKYAVPGQTTLPNGLPYQNSYLKADIEATDYAIGLLLDGIPQSVLAQTLIIFWSDNGTAPGNANPGDNTNHMKQTPYEQGCNTPLVCAGAGVAQPGRVCDFLVSAADLYQTCIDASGGTISVPQTPGFTRDSISFMPYLTNPAVASSLRTTDIYDIFATNGPALNAPTLGDRAFSNDKGYKLIRKHAAGVTGWPSSTGGAAAVGWEFYFYSGDPFETVNLIGNGSPFVSGGIINLTDGNPLYPSAKTQYDALVASYAVSQSSFT